MVGVVFANPFGEYVTGETAGRNDRLKQEQVVFQTVIQPALSAREKALDRSLKLAISGRRAARASANQAAGYSASVQDSRGAAPSAGGPAAQAAAGGATTAVTAGAGRVVGGIPAQISGRDDLALPAQGGSLPTGLPARLVNGTAAVATTAAPTVVATAPQNVAGTGNLAPKVTAAPAPQHALLPAGSQSRLAGGGDPTSAARAVSDARVALRSVVGATDDRVRGVLSPTVAQQLQIPRGPAVTQPLNSLDAAAAQLDAYLNATNPSSTLVGVR